MTSSTKACACVVVKPSPTPAQATCWPIDIVLSDVIIQELQINWSEPTWDKAGHSLMVNVVKGADDS